MAHCAPEATIIELDHLLPTHPPSLCVTSRVTPILSKASQGAFGSYLDIKRPSKAVLQDSPSLPPIPSPGNSQLLLLQKIDILTSVVNSNSQLIREILHNGTDPFAKFHECVKKHLAFEIGKVPGKVTIWWTFLLKILFLILILLLLIFHLFLERRQ